MWQLPPTNISVGSLVGKIVALTIHHLSSISVPFIFLVSPEVRPVDYLLLKCSSLPPVQWINMVMVILCGGWELHSRELMILMHWECLCIFPLFFSFPVLGWNKGRGITVALKCSKYEHPGEGPTLHPGIDYSMRWSGLIWRNHSSHNYFILYCSWMVSKLVSGAESLAHFPCKIKLLALCSGMNTGLLM